MKKRISVMISLGNQEYLARLKNEKGISQSFLIDWLLSKVKKDGCVKLGIVPAKIKK